MLAVMKPFPRGSGADMIWTRTRALPNEWELSAGGEVIGILKWPRLFSSQAEGETTEGHWNFRGTGLLSRRTEVTDEATRACLAVFERKFGGRGEVTFPDGRRVLWTNQGWFPRVPLFTTTDGFPIMRFPLSFGWTRKETLQIDETARAMQELPLLALLGRYLIVLCRRRSHH